MVSVDDWTAGEAFALVRRAYPYHRLTHKAFDEVLSMLSGKYSSELAAELEPRMTWDRVNDRLAGTRASRMMAVISGGTIPDRGLYTVNLADRTRLGELDEEFVHDSRVGDVFQLGSATWRIRAIEHDRVIVTPAPGSSSTREETAQMAAAMIADAQMILRTVTTRSRVKRRWTRL